MALTGLAVVLLCLPIVTGQYGFLPDFYEQSRLSFTSGDDVTLTCPVTLHPGEQYDRVKWTFLSCGRYYFKIPCYEQSVWSREQGLERKEGPVIPQIPEDSSVKATATVKNITNGLSGYYLCQVIGTGSTDQSHVFDVYVLKNASAVQTLKPDPILVVKGATGSVQVTCTDEAYVPGSIMRIYHGSWSFRVAFFDLPTVCTITYDPETSSEIASCQADIAVSILTGKFTLQNSVNCDVIRPGGKRISLLRRARIVDLGLLDN
ncbi:uncharacterized protein LOC124113883 [Haliotis rufescens]|uniref:uncharacterized protein LOC124113883 n=1 Tax=Haliotis rufescens TaxID=6454 RepID=UPI00201EF8DD|nr:uncharacterized protein LOC124113883 [Haliotis rufescens]